MYKQRYLVIGIGESISGLLGNNISLPRRPLGIIF